MPLKNAPPFSRAPPWIWPPVTATVSRSAANAGSAKTANRIMRMSGPPTVDCIALHGGAAYAQPVSQPINDLPNPYRTVRDWGKPPGGVPWAAVTAVEVSPDGSIYVIHRCKDNSCSGRPEPPILKFDKSGKLLTAWGENMFVFPHGATVDAQGNLWVTDSQIKDGKGHQVFKFSPDGKMLMTLGKAGGVSAAPGEFDEPTDALIAANGDIFITEGHSGGTTGNDRVSKFDKNGKFLKSFGKH